MSTVRRSTVDSDARRRTPSAPVAAIAFAHKPAVYDLLFKLAAETITTVAADPNPLGARVGLTPQDGRVYRFDAGGVAIGG